MASNCRLKLQVVGICRHAHVPLTVPSQQIYQMGRAAGFNKEDGSALVKLYERMAGTQLGPRK